MSPERGHYNWKLLGRGGEQRELLHVYNSIKKQLCGCNSNKSFIFSTLVSSNLQNLQSPGSYTAMHYLPLHDSSVYRVKFDEMMRTQKVRIANK